METRDQDNGTGIIRKGYDNKKFYEDYLFIYSGGDTAKNGVGFLVHPEQK